LLKSKNGTIVMFGTNLNILKKIKTSITEHKRDY
jgi:hypothetical protein